MNTLVKTDKDRMVEALAAFRATGARFRINVMKCCRGCVEMKNVGLQDGDEETPYAWTYGSQGNKLFWVDGIAHRAAEHWEKQWSSRTRNGMIPLEQLYIYHGNGAGQTMRDALVNAGFDVEWDGDESSAILVKLTGKTDEIPF